MSSEMTTTGLILHSNRKKVIDAINQDNTPTIPATTQNTPKYISLVKLMINILHNTYLLTDSIDANLEQSQENFAHLGQRLVELHR